MLFLDRREAGRRLAEALLPLREEDPVVLGLPRGGVPVAAEVSRALHAPLDVLVVRKLGCPWEPELGMGAVGEAGVVVLNEGLIARLGVSSEDVEEVAKAERVELDRRLRRFRGDRAPIPVEGRTVIVVDDGIATGSTARAALAVLRRRRARRIVLAVPVAPSDSVEELRRDADEVIVLARPAAFFAIGQFYADFEQVGDEEVAACLVRAAGDGPDLPGDPDGHEEPRLNGPDASRSRRSRMGAQSKLR